MNRHEFEVRYSQAQIRRATWAYVRKTLGKAMKWSGWLAFGGLLGVWCWLLIDGVTSVMVWVIPGFIVTVWQVHISHSLDTLSRMKRPVARVVADDEGLSVTTDLGSSTMPWTTFTEWIDVPDAIYLKAGKRAMVSLPIDGVDARALQLIRERIAAGQPKG